MRKYTIIAVLPVLFLFGAGCTSKTPVPEPSVEVNLLNEQPVPDTQRQVGTENVVSKVDASNVGTELYRGTWFDIEYPETFTASPTSPSTETSRGPFVETDEATFTSPNGDVEFFVYSPAWAGDPKDYLNVAATEELVSKKTETRLAKDYPDQYGDKIIRWVTIKAKDGSYYRSYLSIKEQENTESKLHHVFGITYKDQTAYENNKTAYEAFKNSLAQYAD